MPKLGVWLRLTGLAVVAALGLTGCASYDTSRVDTKLSQADQTRLEAEASPQAQLVRVDLAASRQHQKKAEEWLEKLDSLSLFVWDESDKEYLAQADTEAQRSLLRAEAALVKVRQAEVEARKTVAAAKAKAPKETNLKPAAGPPAPVGSAAPVKTQAAPAVSKPAAPAAEAGPPLPDNPKALYKFGLNQYRSGKFVLSRRSLVAFLGRYPKHALAVNAQYWIGETYYSQKEFVMALGAFQAVLSHYPKGRKAPDALLKIGLTELNLGRKAKARAALKECLKRFPKSPPAALARRYLAKL